MSEQETDRQQRALQSIQKRLSKIDDEMKDESPSVLSKILPSSSMKYLPKLEINDLPENVEIEDLEHY